MLSYHAPASLQEAVRLLADLGESALLIAGGTDIARAPEPAALHGRRMVNLREIRELHGVAESRTGGLRIGALTTHRAIARSLEVAGYCRALAQACASVGTVRILNQGTIGGSLMQGDPRYDPPAMLLALAATVDLVGPAGTRTIAVDDLVDERVAAGDPPGEILVQVDLPQRAASARASYLKFAPAGAAEDSTVTVAAALDFDPTGACSGARLFLGAIGDARVRLRHAEAALVGQPLARATVESAAEAALTDVAALIDQGRLDSYEQRLVRVCTSRALDRVA